MLIGKIARRGSGSIRCVAGKLEEERPQFGVGSRVGGSAQGACCGRGEPEGYGVVAWRCREWYHPCGHGRRRQPDGVQGLQDAGLIQAGAGSPGRRFNQQQDAIVAQAGVPHVFAQRCRQRGNQSLAQAVNVAGPRRKVGNGRALRQGRRAAGIAWWLHWRQDR